MSTLRCLPVVLFLVSLASCGGSADAGSTGSGALPPGITAAGLREAKELFRSLCSTCHGMTGHGDGPGAAALNPKPRTFADEAWQASVTDEHIQKTIVFGGAAVGKSAVMPAQPDLKGKTDVLLALTRIVRSYRPK